MKQLRLLALFTVLILGLSACQITVSGSVDGLPSGFNVSNADFTTNYQGEINGMNRFIICDNKTTQLTYSFNYTGTLNQWSSYLQGVKTGNIAGKASFTSDQIVAPGRVEVKYTIPSQTSPLLVEPDLTTQGIVIVPKPTVIGYTKLFININGFSKSYPLISSDIPVVDTCP